MIQIQAQISPTEANQGQAGARPYRSGSRTARPSFNSQTVGPTFGAEIARKAIIAIVFSLLVIAAYVAIRFEAKYAVPVLIALVHDILITGGRLRAAWEGR